MKEVRTIEELNTLQNIISFKFSNLKLSNLWCSFGRTSNNDTNFFTCLWCNLEYKVINFILYIYEVFNFTTQHNNHMKNVREYHNYN